jgi:hypothetical protein
MPFKSKAQNAWAHTPAGTKALGGAAKVKEWEGATDYSHLPQKLAKGGIVKPIESAKHEAMETPAEEAWEQKTGKELPKGKRAPHHQNMEKPHSPSIGGHNNGHGVFAQGGPVRNERPDRFYKTKDRNEYGKFLSTEDRFTGGRKPAGFPQEAETEENWVKPAGVGRTDPDDIGDCKKLKPVMPNKAGNVSYAKKGTTDTSHIPE